uniref:Uncharacterized protein n=1 Tax=Anguilla anguilla TaxID=7936 RepID=A0A0E9WMS9_ANGAN
MINVFLLRVSSIFTGLASGRFFSISLFLSSLGDTTAQNPYPMQTTPTSVHVVKIVLMPLMSQNIHSPGETKVTEQMILERKS